MHLVFCICMEISLSLSRTRLQGDCNPVFIHWIRSSLATLLITKSWLNTQLLLNPSLYSSHRVQKLKHRCHLMVTHHRGPAPFLYLGGTYT